MTLKEAYAQLRPPLVFGQETQVKAVRFISTVAEVVAQLKDCPHSDDNSCDDCDGEGTTACTCLDCGHEHDAKCDECGGTGNRQALP